MIFRPISLFLLFGFTYFHLFIYILPYLTHTRRIEERFGPPIVWDYCDFTVTVFPLQLHLTPRTVASSYRPLTHYRIFYWISIEFLSHRYHISIASHCAPRIVTSHIETVYRKGLPRPRTFYIDLSVVFVLIIFRSYRHCGRISGIPEESSSMTSGSGYTLQMKVKQPKYFGCVM